MPIRPVRAPVALWAAAGLCAAAVVPGAVPAAAQRPFDAYDPLYQSETARRAYLGTYALGVDVTVRASGGGADSAALSLPLGTRRGPLGLALRADYALGPSIDVGAVVDVAAVGGGQAVRWSWIVGRYAWTVDATDYGLRLALDPDSDGRTGFPQADLALLATSPLSPRVTSDVAIGLRRVRRGFQEVVPRPDAPPPLDPATDFDVAYGRAIGWEAHAMVTYGYLLSPSGSRVFGTVSAERGAYDLVRIAALGGDVEGERQAGDVRAGVVWARAGGEFARPSLRLVPFLAVPLVRWGPPGPTPARATMGLEVTLR